MPLQKRFILTLLTKPEISPHRFLMLHGTGKNPGPLEWDAMGLCVLTFLSFERRGCSSSFSRLAVRSISYKQGA